MYAEKSASYAHPQKRTKENRVKTLSPMSKTRQPVSLYFPNRSRMFSKSFPASYVMQMQIDTESSVIQRQMNWDRFQEAFNLAGTWLDKALQNVFHPNARQIFAYAKIRYTEKNAFRIIGKVSRAYNNIQQILSSWLEGALAWVNPLINTTINISEDHVNSDPLEDVATTILHELSHYSNSLDTDDIEYIYTQEEFEQGSDQLTYATAINNADSIAFLIRGLANL